MYSLKTILKQEPSSIAAVLVLVMNVLVLAHVFAASKDVILAVNATFIPVLSLFYIRPLTASKDALAKLGNGAPAANVVEPPAGG